jgi:hypothetical protein
MTVAVSWDNLFAEQPFVVISKIRAEQAKNPNENVLAILKRVLTEFGVPEHHQSVYRSDIGRLLLKHPR